MKTLLILTFIGASLPAKAVSIIETVVCTDHGERTTHVYHNVIVPDFVYYELNSEELNEWACKNIDNLKHSNL